MQAVLGGPEDIECRFWIKVVEASRKPQEVKKPEKVEEPPLGLPEYALVYEQRPSDQPNAKTWEDLGSVGISIDWNVVMHPFIEEDKLKVVYINMDSTVLRRYKSKQGNLTLEQADLADRRYLSSIYFHSIFLYSITRNRKYELKQESREVDLDDYLRDLFSSYYSEFLLNFGTDQLMQALGD
jgi:hypothetical protein